jgi:hypothetical protein
MCGDALKHDCLILQKLIESAGRHAPPAVGTNDDINELLWLMNW